MEGDQDPLAEALKKKAPKDFEFGKVLGEGSYSTVVHAKEKSSGREFAIKVLDKRHIVKEKKVKYVQIEKEVLNKVSPHHFIVRLYYTFQSQSSLYFVLEYVTNGDLLGLIRRYSKFTEKAAQFYAAEILSGVEFLHFKRIIHRDLKPENILIDSKWHIKIADFGSAKILAPESNNKESTTSDETTKKNSFVGTAEYCSPELLNDRAATFASDVWAIGCILYQLLAGRPPFKGGNEYQTFQKILKLEFSFSEEFPLSPRSLVEKLLVLDPGARSTLQQAKNHAFFQDVNWEGLIDLESPFVNEPSIVDEVTDGFEEMALGISTGELEREPTYPHEKEEATTAAAFPPASLPRVAHPQAVAPVPLLEMQEREKALIMQKSSPLAPLVGPTELIVMAGSVYKNKTLVWSKKVGLMLTDLPRLILFADGSYKFHEELHLVSDLQVYVKDQRNFCILLPNKVKWTITDIDQNAQRWVDAITKQKQSI